MATADPGCHAIPAECHLYLVCSLQGQQWVIFLVSEFHFSAALCSRRTAILLPPQIGQPYPWLTGLKLHGQDPSNLSFFLEFWKIFVSSIVSHELHPRWIKALNPHVLQDLEETLTFRSFRFGRNHGVLWKTGHREVCRLQMGLRCHSDRSVRFVFLFVWSFFDSKVNTEYFFPSSVWKHFVVFWLKTAPIFGELACVLFDDS